MADRSLIVARIDPADAPHIARLFAESDSTELPHVLGVRSRHLFHYQDLYFHLVEFGGDRHEALRRAAGRSDFRALSDALGPYARAYDPRTWRSPADAMATQFYSWSPAGGAEAGHER